MRSRQHHLFRAWLLFIFAGLCLILLPVFSFFTENLTLGQGIGMGLFAALIFSIVGFINYSMYKSDLDADRYKDRRIESLEKELQKRKD